jgi:HEAT repeat protein
MESMSSIEAGHANVAKLSANLVAQAVGSLDSSAGESVKTLSKEEVNRRFDLAVKALKGEIPSLTTATSEAAPATSAPATIQRTPLQIGEEMVNSYKSDKESLPLLKAESPSERLQAKGIIAALIDDLKDNSVSVRHEAVQGLGKFRLEPNNVVPVLIKVLLEDTAGGVRKAAAMSLANFKSEATDIVPALIRASTDKSRSVRIEAIQSLVECAEDVKNVKEVLPALINTLRDHDDLVRKAGAKSLGHFQSSEAKDVVPALCGVLQDKFLHVVFQAIESLAAFPKDLGEAVPRLVEVLRKYGSDCRYDFYEPVPIKIIKILEKLGPEIQSAIPPLIEALKGGPIELQYHVAQLLGKFGPQAKDAVQILVTKLKYGDKTLRGIVSEALGKIGPGAEEAVPALIEVILNPKLGNRFLAAWALGKIGAGAKEAIPTLTWALDSKDSQLRDAAQEALRKIQAMDV